MLDQARLFVSLHPGGPGVDLVVTRAVAGIGHQPGQPRLCPRHLIAQPLSLVGEVTAHLGDLGRRPRIRLR